MPSGPGGLDAVSKTWVYGEADNADGLASGLLNLLASSVKNALAAAGTGILDRLTALEKPPAVRATTTVTSIAVGAVGAFTTAVPFNVETYDTDTAHDIVTNNSRFTATKTGYYRVRGKIQGAASTTYGVQLGVNGTLLPETTVWAAFATGEFATPSTETVIFLTAGQYVQLFAAATTASAAASTQATLFEMTYVRKS